MEEENIIAEENKEESNLESSESGLEKNFLELYGEFKYGHNHGLLYLIADGEEGELLLFKEAFGSKKELEEITLGIDSEVFLEAIDMLAEKNIYKSQKIKMDLRNDFNPTMISHIVQLSSSDEEELKVLFQEKLEDIVREQVKIKLSYNLLNKEELKEAYPKLFPEDDLEKAEGKEKNKGNLKDKLNLDIKLNCTPIISPVAGKKITALGIGDKIAVNIVDDGKNNKASSLITDERGVATGIISQIAFNQEIDRYNVLLQFNENIYGKLVVGSEVKLAVEEIKNKVTVDEDDQETQKVSIQKDSIIIYGLLALLILLIGTITLVVF